MIITRFKASNILKYEQLDLIIPEQGLIAISGQNESGKSSIGEAVCFALFGRTFSVSPKELNKVVRWGENHCAVTLWFKVGQDQYELSRFLDRDGNHSAKLSRQGDAEPMVRGVAPVAEYLLGLLGFGYEEFVESFYLAQREITTPHPHSHAVKIMAGIASMEQVVAEIDGEIEQRQELLEDVQTECEAVEREIAELEIRPGHLEQLESELAETREQAQHVEQLQQQIDNRLEIYCANTRQAYRANSARSRALFLRFVFFLLAVVAGATWWLLAEQPEQPVSQQIQTLLGQYWPQWQELVELIWVAYAAAGMAVLFLIFALRANGLARRTQRLRAQAGELGETLAAARELDIEIEAEPPLAQEQQSVDPNADLGAAESLLSDRVVQRPEPSQWEQLRDAVTAAEATARQVREYAECELAWLAQVSELLQLELLHLEESIEQEQQRLHEAKRLQKVLSGLLEQRNEVSGRITLRRKALELLQGAIMHLSNNFNRDIKDLVARMLPLFTDGRYEHLQIDGDLRVRVFSNEKRDFMALEEVSSGTQRQIMLALRLALSQKLLSRAVKGKQFAFLDEPFAFFDDERTRKALTALANLGEDVSQVWIVAQTFPENAIEFDINVQCQRSENRLVVG